MRSRRSILTSFTETINKLNAEKLDKRVGESFEGVSREDMSKYLDWLRSNIAENTLTMRRTFLLMILLVAVFELLIREPGAKLGLGGFQVTAGPVTLLVIPVLVAYLFLQLAITSRYVRMSMLTFSLVFERWLPNISKKQLDSPLLPPRPIFWNFGIVSDPGPGLDIVDRIEDGLSVLSKGIIIFAVGVFVTQAYSAMSRFSLNPFMRTASFFITVAIFLIGILYELLIPYFTSKDYRRRMAKERSKIDNTPL